jgi:SAM-dependent methyltransferase
MDQTTDAKHNYADLTTANRSFLKRFSHRRRFDVALDLLTISTADRVLDYVAGSLYIPSRILSVGAAEVWAFEPHTRLFDDMATELRARSDAKRIHLVKDVNTLEAGSVDKVCCLEVLEHLPNARLHEALVQIARVLRPLGVCVVSVPLEIGLSALLKNCARHALRQSHGGANISNIVKATLGIRIKREQDVDFIDSHVGFDHRDVLKHLENHPLRLRGTHYSPFPPLGPMINSQIFYLLEKVQAG